MARNNELDVCELNKRIKQQEQTIAQLVSIIASSNRRLEELEQRQNMMERSLLSSCSTSPCFA